MVRCSRCPPPFERRLNGASHLLLKQCASAPGLLKKKKKLNRVRRCNPIKSEFDEKLGIGQPAQKQIDNAFPSPAIFAAPTDRPPPPPPVRPGPSRCSPASPTLPPIAARPPSAGSRRAAVAAPMPPRGFPLDIRFRQPPPPPHPNPRFRTPPSRARPTEPPHRHRSQSEPAPRPPRPPGPRGPVPAWGAEERPRRR